MMNLFTAAGSSLCTQISRDRVDSILSDHDLIAVIEKCLVEFSASHRSSSSNHSPTVLQPMRTMVEVQKGNGYFGCMPGYASYSGALAVKVLTMYDSNAKKGLPTVNAVVLYFDSADGRLLAMIDGVSITSSRTAAASAVALKHLVRKDASVLAVVGTGVQASCHITMLKKVHSFQEIDLRTTVLQQRLAPVKDLWRCDKNSVPSRLVQVRIVGRSEEVTKTVAAKLGAEPYFSVAEAVKDADVVVTATMSKEPVVHYNRLKSNALVLVIGACVPDWREVDDDIMAHSQVIVDSEVAAFEESGDIIQTKSPVLGEIGDVIAGKVSVDKSKMILFKSLGLGIEDVVTAKLVWDVYQKETQTNS